MDLSPSLMLVIEDMKKQQKEQHRVTMVIFRKKKKETILKQQQECPRLEREIKLFAKTARAKAACSTVGDTARASTSIVVKLKKSVVVWETLSRENRALRDKIKSREDFEQAIRKPNQAETDGETLLLLPVDSQSGHRVYFDHEEPSFHFYPFTRAEFDTGMKNFDAELTRGIQSVSVIGNILGWDVYRAPLVTNANSVLQRVQLTKRMCYPLDDILRASYAKDKFLCPMVVLPAGFSLHQRHKVSTKVLQEFDQDSSVFVCNIPGPEKHLRFLYFIRRMQWKFPDGRRKITVSIAVADSTLNRHSRDADEAESVE